MKTVFFNTVLIMMTIGFAGTPLCEEALPLPYAQVEWPTIHRDVHNSDFIPTTLGTFSANESLRHVRWILRDEEGPSVAMTAGAIGVENGEAMFICHNR